MPRQTTERRAVVTPLKPFLDSFQVIPPQIILELVHGHKEGGFFKGYAAGYMCWCSGAGIC